MSTAVLKKAASDPDQWLEMQIIELTTKLLKRPVNNRGPFVISDSMLSSSSSKVNGGGRIKVIK